MARGVSGSAASARTGRLFSGRKCRGSVPAGGLLARAVHGGDGGSRGRQLLGPGAAGDGVRGSPGSADVRETVRGAAQERRGNEPRQRACSEGIWQNTGAWRRRGSRPSPGWRQRPTTRNRSCRSWSWKLAGCCSSRSGSWTRRCASGRKRAMKRSGYGHSGHWPHLRHGDPSFRAANGGLPAQAGFLGLARLCPPPVLDRGKAKALRDLEDGAA